MSKSIEYGQNLLKMVEFDRNGQLNWKFLIDFNFVLMFPSKIKIFLIFFDGIQIFPFQIGYV